MDAIKARVEPMNRTNLAGGPSRLLILSTESVAVSNSY